MSKIKVKRVPKRGIYDRETIYSILDKTYICNLAFVHEDYPVVIPTMYGRDGDKLYVHGSMASRMMKDLDQGIKLSLCVVIPNGLVLARSSFHHSMNYESVVLFGTATQVTGEEAKNHALKIVSDHIIPGRWEEARLPNAKELKATMVLEIPIEEVSAKVRAGDPGDDKADYNTGIWAGIVPYNKGYATPIPDPLLEKNVPIPKSVENLLKKH